MAAPSSALNRRAARRRSAWLLAMLCATGIGVFHGEATPAGNAGGANHGASAPRQ
ncbi:hypothetical protein SODG_006466 [Sodalis praecaptivus]